MPTSTPSSLGLTNVADGAPIIASDHRTNYSAIQVAVNALITLFNLVTGKGELLVASASGTYDHLAVGSNGQVLTADSTQTLGVKWAAAPAGSNPLTAGQGGSLTAASTVTVTNQIHAITGGTTVDTINSGAGGAVVVLHCIGIVSFSSAGNIFATGASGTRAVPANAAITLAWNVSSAKWNVAGVGS